MTGDLIVALGPIEEELESELRSFAPVVTATDDAEVRPLLANAIGLVARGANLVDRGMLEQAPKLRVIGRTGIGVDRIDLQAASARGIPVVVTPTAGTRAVAEGALALMLHLIKRLGRFTDLIRDGRWQERDRWTAGDLDGATVGVVGYGRIGHRVAELAGCFGARVVVTDPVLDGRAEEDGHTVADLLGLVGRADVITLHVPLTEATRHLINRAVLREVKPGALLINCARGGLVDLDATYEALVDGRLAGVGLDVYDPEPPPPRHPLFDSRDVVLTPHVMGLSARAWRATSIELAAGMVAVLSGGQARHVANPEIYPSDPR